MNSRKFLKLFILSVSAGLVFSTSLYAASTRNARVIESKYGVVEYQTNTGGVTFYAKTTGKKPKRIPVVSIPDSSDATSPVICIDGASFKLLTSNLVKTKCDINNGVMMITYEVAKVHKVVITYQFTKHTNEGDNIHITYAVTNLSGSPHEYEFKYIFDTVLGQSKSKHFDTAVKGISSETVITSFEKHRFVLSNNDFIGIKFPLNDEVKDKIYKVVMANRVYFNANTYEGVFQEGRSLNAVLSYNDSCVGFWFKPFDAADGKTVTFSQNINIFVTDFDAPSYYDTPDKTAFASDSADDKDKMDAEAVDAEDADKKALLEAQRKAQQAQEALNSDKKPVVEIPEENINFEYAHDLIRRINELDPKTAKKADIVKLQVELEQLMSLLNKTKK